MNEHVNVLKLCFSEMVPRLAVSTLSGNLLEMPSMNQTFSGGSKVCVLTRAQGDSVGART